MGECLIVRKGSQPEGTATPSQVLSGATFQSANSDELQTGTMTLKSFGSKPDWIGKQSDGVTIAYTSTVPVAIASDGTNAYIKEPFSSFGTYPNANWLLSGATATGACGFMVAGDMPNNGTVVANVYDGDDYYIPKGYHNGAGHIKNASQLYRNVNWVQAQYTTEKYSDICYTRATTQLNYLITCTAHGNTSYAKVEGSNDGTNWTVLKEVDCQGGYSVTDDIVTGYAQYRSYVKANGSGSQTTFYSSATCKMSYFI